MQSRHTMRNRQPVFSTMFSLTFIHTLFISHRRTFYSFYCSIVFFFPMTSFSVFGCMLIGEYKFDRRNDICKQLRICQQRFNNKLCAPIILLLFFCKICDWVTYRRKDSDHLIKIQFRNKLELSEQETRFLTKIIAKMQASYVLSLFMMMVAMCGVQSAISQVSKNLESNGLTDESSAGVRDVDDLTADQHHWYRRRIYRRLGEFHQQFLFWIVNIQ